MKVDLSTYDNNWYKPGNSFKRFIWHYVNLFFFKSGLFPVYGLKVFLLKLFGANIGKNVSIKPYVNIKYPWFLTIGNNVWIGEDVWIDNLATVKIGNDVCISQGALLLTGSHNYSSTNFGLITKPIILENGVWICAKSIICAGVTCHNHSLITAGTIVTGNCDGYGIYKGNPAIKIKIREITS
jgi:putative colanic acid biosynthesis acetyltransferase WcaF